MMIGRSVVALLAILAPLAGCSERLSEPQQEHEEGHGPSGHISFNAETYETAGITVAPVGVRTLQPTIRVTGTLSYDERSLGIATARIGGRITKVIADYGQRVSPGEALAWIDSPELGAAQADYRRAQSMSRLRLAEHERALLLLDGEAISRGELLRREAEMLGAKADLETAEQKLHILGLSQTDIEALSNGQAGEGHEYPVRAPIGGLVTERMAIPGRVVSAEDELFTVARLDSLWLFLQVFEKDLPAVEEGATVTLTCESHPNDRFRGTIDFVGQVLDPHSRTARARAVIENPDGELKPGMFVYARIEGRIRNGGGSDLPVIPTTAVTSLKGEEIVFIQMAEREFEPRPVLPGQTSDGWVEIRSGLAAGESIAVTGLFMLKSELLKSDLAEDGH
jgi:cobalt-zinc-cadmium efflux system membrane fusion protein